MGDKIQVPEEKIQQLMRIWPGNLPHARAKKKLEWLVAHGCNLSEKCMLCPKCFDGTCPALPLDGDDD